MSWKARDLKIEEYVADNYDLLYYSTRFAHHMYDVFAAEVARCAPSSGPVLELGCGTALITRRLKILKPAIQTHCMDFSPKMLAIAEKHCDNCLLADLEDNWPYPDSYFGLVFVHSALHHFPSFDRIFANVNRVLKPGGHFLIQEPNESMIRVAGMKWVEWFLDKARAKRYPNLKYLEGGEQPSEHHGKLSLEQISKALVHNGFQVISAKQKFFATAELRLFDSGLIFLLTRALEFAQTPRGYMFSVSALKP